MFAQNSALSGLTSYSCAAPTAGAYFVSGKIQLPRLASGGTQSNVVATITNGTGQVTLMTTTAGSDGFYVDTLCAAGDVLTVALTSSTAGDEVLNAIKCEISIGSGQ